MTSRIDYDAIKEHHGVDGCYSDSETRRRLREVRYHDGRHRKEVQRMQRVLNRKSDLMNETERRVLQQFPAGGIDIEYCSKALIYADVLRRMSKREHIAIVSLMRMGWIGIVQGFRDGQTVQILCKL